MYKTVWLITDKTDDTTTQLTYYHFKREPKFPSWYLEEERIYEIEMLWNLSLVHNPKLFFKCLTHFYKIN